MQCPGWRSALFFCCLFIAIFVVQAAALRVVADRTGLWVPTPRHSTTISGKPPVESARLDTYVAAPMHPDAMPPKPRAGTLMPAHDTPREAILLEPDTRRVPSSSVTLARIDKDAGAVALPSAPMDRPEEPVASVSGASEAAWSYFDPLTRHAMRAVGSRKDHGPVDVASPIAAAMVESAADSIAVQPLETASDDLVAAWLRDSPPEHLTLQIQAGTNLRGLQAFAAKHALPEPQSYVRSVRNGRPWYALVVGHYAEARGAQAAATALTVKLRGTKPWIRTAGNIQAQAE
jgi:septal ring-binding cell division protein DamX